MHFFHKIVCGMANRVDCDQEQSGLVLTAILSEKLEYQSCCLGGVSGGKSGIFFLISE